MVMDASDFITLNTYLTPNATDELYYFKVITTEQLGYTATDLAVENATIYVKKYINASWGFMNVSVLKTDANGQANLYLMPNTLYKVLVNKSGYYNSTGDYIPAPASTYGTTVEKIFKLVAIPTTSGVTYYFNDNITLSGSMGNNTKIITIFYEDELSMTTNWQLNIYRTNPNATTLIPVISWVGTNNTFTLKGNITTTWKMDYVVVFHMNHTYFGANVLTLRFYGYIPKLTSGTRFNHLFALNYGYNPFGWANTVFFFIMMGCFFSFGRRDAFMILFAIGFLMLFTNIYIGIETAWSAILGGALPMFIIFVGILMIVRDRGMVGAS
jgi:hypothetical protein